MDVEDFADCISTYPIYTPVQRKSLKSLQKESRIRDIFGTFNDHLVWSFLDFNLLECIIRDLGSRELKGLMKAYSNKMKEFRKKTKATTLIDIWDESGVVHIHHYKECKQLFLSLNLNPDECTLHRLDDIRTRACRLVIGYKPSLAEAALVLYKVKYGSITLIWIVHVSLVQQFKDAFRQCITGVFFEENNITRLELDGVVFIPNQVLAIVLINLMMCK